MMKKKIKIFGITMGVLLLLISIFLVVNNEPLPEGIQGKEADRLARNMMKALNKRAFDNTEVLEWTFRGKHQYKWRKQEGIVEVSWSNAKVILNLNDLSKSMGENPKMIKKAFDYFNNDSFWLVAPYKVFDEGTERRIVKHENKDALLITYTSGGSTPGDSYLWILDSTYVPTSFKMWTQLIPIGGISATWDQLKNSQSGIKLPIKHRIPLIGLNIDMGEAKAYNPNADKLAHRILDAVKHEAYKNTRYIDWSFKNSRFYKWDKQQHIVEVQWNDARVILHPNALSKSVVYLNDKKIIYNESIVNRALTLFNNDSFWLVAPHKLFEPGIYRGIETIDGKEALYVTYSEGGSTPGDSYLWKVDKDYVPMSYQMFVPSKKIDGVSVSWDDWIETESGTLFPKKHRYASSGRELDMGNVKGYN